MLSPNMLSQRTYPHTPSHSVELKKSTKQNMVTRVGKKGRVPYPKNVHIFFFFSLKRPWGSSCLCLLGALCVKLDARIEASIIDLKNSNFTSLKKSIFIICNQ